MSDSGKSRRLSPAEMRKKKIKRFAIGSIPFGIYIFKCGVDQCRYPAVYCAGVFVAIFLTKRDAQQYLQLMVILGDVINTDATKPTKARLKLCRRRRLKANAFVYLLLYW